MHLFNLYDTDNYWKCIEDLDLMLPIQHFYCSDGDLWVILSNEEQYYAHSKTQSKLCVKKKTQTQTFQ